MRSPIDGERRKSGAVISRVVRFLRFPRFVIKLNPGPAAGIGPRGLPQNPHVVHGGYRCSTYLPVARVLISRNQRIQDGLSAAGCDGLVAVNGR